MKKNILQIFISLITLSAIIYLFYIILQYIVDNIGKLDANIFIGILGATVTITSFFITRYLERKKMIEMDIRNKKIPIYEEFINFYFKIIFQSKNKKKSNDNDEIIDFFRSFNQKAIIWFPDKILKAYIDWKHNIINFSQQEISLKDIILMHEEFLKLIREDIGHHNKEIQNWDISSLYINDLDEIKQSP